MYLKIKLLQKVLCLVKIDWYWNTKKDYKYLKCLKDSFEFLEGTSQKDAQAEFTDIVNEFAPIFNIIRKIWT